MAPLNFIVPVTREGLTMIGWPVQKKKWRSGGDKPITRWIAPLFSIVTTLGKLLDRASGQQMKKGSYSGCPTKKTG
ncbi:hypothetical protein ACQZ4R_13935 [Agrobacterium vitis]